MNHYNLDLPAAVAFSDGRTSGHMLHEIMRATDTSKDFHAVFCNTGKERLETLDFVHEIETRWSIPVIWLEYRFDAPADCPTRHSDYTEISKEERDERWRVWHNDIKPFRESGEQASHRFREVNYKTASRIGQPFDEVIASRQYLPNRVTRFCTSELKVKTMWRWAKSVGLSATGYTKAVGLRADEPGRVQRLLAGSGETRASEEIVCPLATAGVTLADVMAFWKSQPFDLQLQPHEGNCDLCFLKRKGSILSIMRDRPDLAEWWVDKEKDGRLFRSTKDRPRYSLLMADAQRPDLFDLMDDEDDISCACTD